MILKNYNVKILELKAVLYQRRSIWMELARKPEQWTWITLKVNKKVSEEMVF